MKAFLVLCLILIVVGFGLSSFFFEVKETEYAIVTFFGDPRRIVDEPGLEFKWPWPIESVVRIERRAVVTAPEEAEYLTKDKKNVLVSFFVAWKVTDPLRFLVTVNDVIGAESRIQDIIRSEVGAQLGRYDLVDFVYEASPEAGEGDAGGSAPEGSVIAAIMNDVSGRVSGSLKTEFGIDVVAVRMRRLNFPSQNKKAVFERMEAERERIARQLRSEGEEQAEVLKAEADRRQAALINAALLEAEKIKGGADAEAARIYAEAYGQDPEFYEFLRKLEAYESFLNEKATIVIPADSPLLEVLKEEK
jgi:membrane protease subunit HflC